jgi:hypothetical protein
MLPRHVTNEAEPLIRLVCDEQQRFQASYGIEAVRIFGRPLQLIDCQNLFCETGKYARIAYPYIKGYSGRTRIKQLYKTKGPIATPVFPAKWSVYA